MRGRDLRRLWAASAAEGGGAGGLRRRAGVIAAAFARPAALERLTTAEPASLLARTVAGRPEILLLVKAPYLCADWDGDERIAQFVHHIETMAATGPLLDFGVDDSIELMPLPFGEGYHVVIDKPIWFHREGTATLNLFRDNRRLFSLSFALMRDGGRRVALIGGLQGRNLPAILDEYRVMTKLAEGVRPRDLLIDLFRMLCRVLAVDEIRAISDASRFHRSAYFGAAKGRQLPLDYDEIWRDRGGTPIDPRFWHLPIVRPHRDEADIPAKKRPMYRRRHDLLERLDAMVAAGVAGARPVRRPEAE